MDILVAILIIALLAAVLFAVMQRRPRGTRGARGARGADQTVTAPVVHRDRIPRNDPMAAAVAEHAEAMDPQDVIVAEERMRAQARQVAAGIQAETNHPEDQSYAQDPRIDGAADPPGTEYADANDYVYPPPPGPGYVDPNADRRR